MKAVFEDYTTAPIADRLKALLGLIKKTTLHPHTLTQADVAAVRQAGASDDMIREAVYICGLFNMIVRLADTLEFEVPALEKYGEAALKRGYAL